MIAAGNKNCIRGVDALTGQVVDLCEDRAVGAAPELPKAPDKYVDPTDYKNCWGCEVIVNLKGKQNPLNVIRTVYAAVFGWGRWVDSHTVGGVADYIDQKMGPEENPTAKWWLARGGAPLAWVAIRDQLRRVKTTEQAVAVLQRQRTASVAAGDIATVQIIDDLITKPSEVLRKELISRRDSAVAAGTPEGTALAEDLDRTLNVRGFRRTRAVGTDDVLGNAVLEQNKSLRKVRGTLVREIQTAMEDATTPAEARVALSRVLKSPGGGNTWAIFRGELGAMTDGTPEKGVLEGIATGVQTRHAREVAFLNEVEEAVSGTETRLYQDFRTPLTTPNPAVGTAIDDARRSLMSSRVKDNLLGTTDGVIRFPKGFAAHDGLYAEIKAAKKAAKAEEAGRIAALRGSDITRAELAVASRDQHLLAAETLGGLVKSLKSKSAAEMLDGIEAVRARAFVEGAVSARTVEALDRVVEAGKKPILNALGIGAGSPLNLSSEVAAGKSPLWRRVRETLAGSYENNTAFRTWLSAWLTFSQIVRGPDEMMDKFGGKDLRGAPRAVAYDALAYGGVAFSAWLTNHEYSRMVSGVGRTKASVAYSFMTAWLVYQYYWYGKVDQREGLRLTGQDPNIADNPFIRDKRFENYNRFASQYYAWVAETPLWALMPEFSKKLAEGISDACGWESKSKTGVTAAEQTALTTDAEAATLETAGALTRFRINALRVLPRAGRTAFGTLERNRASLLWLLTGIMSGTFLATAQAYSRAVTQGDALQGGSIRPLFTSTGSQVIASGLNALGRDMSVYTYYAGGMSYLFLWDYCNEIETGAPNLARANLERYRQAEPGSKEEKEWANAFHFFFQATVPAEQQNLIVEWEKAGLVKKFPELFDGLASLTLPERQKRHDQFMSDMKKAVAMATEMNDPLGMSDDPWVGHF